MSPIDARPEGDRFPADRPSDPMLLFRAGNTLGAVPALGVAETLRPLAIERLPGMAACVLGISAIRGRATPVVDARILLSACATEPAARLVVLRVGERTVALAVDSVLGLQRFEQSSVQALPPLLGGADAGLVAEIGRLDADLLVVLDAGRLVPESVWSALDSQGRA